MFDWIKRLLGLTDCRGCVYRRCWGLCCGKRGGILLHSAWQRYGCWHYAEDEEIEAMREALDKAKRILHCAIVAGILKGDDAYEALDFVNAALARTAHNEEGVN